MGHWVGVSLGAIAYLGPFLDFLFLFLSAMVGVALATGALSAELGESAMAPGTGPLAGVCGAGLHTQPGDPSAHTELTAQLHCGHSQHTL